MDATLLGTSDAYGVPAPLCDCEYCEESDERLRPSMLVQSDDEETTLVLDAGPDIKRQLHETETYDVDAFYLTHHHFDHTNGLSDIFHITLDGNYHNAHEFEHPTHGKTFDVFAPTDTINTLKDESGHLFGRGLKFDSMPANHSQEHGDLTIQSTPVAHGRQQTFGFIVTDETTGEKLVYAPDMARWKAYKDNYKNADALVIEGAEIVGPEIHGTYEQVRRAIETADADETYLVNVSEHTAELHTAELVEAGNPYNVVSDFEQIL